MCDMPTVISKFPQEVGEDLGKGAHYVGGVGWGALRGSGFVESGEMVGFWWAVA